MGSITYDFLNESVLFSEADIENNYASYTNKRIEDEIGKYLEFVMNNSEILEKEVNSVDSDLKVFSSVENQSINYLTQTALYLDQFIIQDPLHLLHVNQTTESKMLGKHVGYSPVEIDKVRIAETCRYLKEITPMIASNHVKLFPIQEYTKKRWNGGLNLPVNNYKGILPEQVENFFFENVKLNNLKSNGNGEFYLNLKDQFDISRAIHVSFGKDNIHNGNMYHLTTMEFSPIDENNNVTMRSYLPDHPPSKEEFETWVNQSINSSAINVYTTTAKEVELGVKLGATFLTDNSLKSDLLRINGGEPENSIEKFSLETFLNYEIPFIDRIDMQSLMDLKEKSGDEFANFRIELQKNLRELRSLNDVQAMKEKIESMYHEFYVVQVNNVNQKMDHLKKQMGATAVISLASLIPAVATNGLSLFGLLVAGAKGYSDYNKYYEKVKTNPSFLFWKSRKKSR